MISIGDLVRKLKGDDIARLMGSQASDVRTTLVLSGDVLGTDQMVQVTEQLKTDKTTTTLTIQNARVPSARDIFLVLDCLLVNRTIKNVSLHLGALTKENCELLCRVLTENHTLTQLDCGQGNISLKRARQIYCALAVNRGLEKFSMAGIVIQNIEYTDQVESFGITVAHLVANNHTLKILHLCAESSGIEFVAFVIITRALRHNRTLTYIAGWGDIRNCSHIFGWYRDELRDIIANHPTLECLANLNRSEIDGRLRPDEGFVMREHLQAPVRLAEINRMQTYTSLTQPMLDTIASYSIDPKRLQPYEVRAVDSEVSYRITQNDIELCLSLFPAKRAEMEKKFAEQQARYKKWAEEDAEMGVAADAGPNL